MTEPSPSLAARLREAVQHALRLEVARLLSDGFGDEGPSENLEHAKLLEDAADALEAKDKALETIQEESAHECECEHDTEDCCERARLEGYTSEFCAFCAASIALVAVPPQEPQV